MPRFDNTNENPGKLNPNASTFVPNSSRPVATQQGMNPAYPPQAMRYGAFDAPQYSNPYPTPTMQYGAPQYSNPYPTPTMQYGAPQYGNPYPAPTMQYGTPQYGNPYPAPTMQYGAPQYSNPYPVARPMGTQPQTMYSAPRPGNSYTAARPTAALNIQAAPPSIPFPKMSPTQTTQTMNDGYSYDAEQFDIAPVTTHNQATLSSVQTQHAMPNASKLVIPVFAYNLPDWWTDAQLTATCQHAEGFINAKMGGRNKNFGFVNFDTLKNAEAFMVSMQNTHTPNGRPVQFRLKDDKRPEPDNREQIPGLIIHYHEAPFANNDAVFNYFKEYCELSYWNVAQNTVTIAPIHSKDIHTLMVICQSNENLISNIEKTSVAARRKSRNLSQTNTSTHSTAPTLQQNSDVPQSSPLASPTSPEIYLDVQPKNAISKAPKLASAAVFAYAIPDTWTDDDLTALCQHAEGFVNAKMATKDGKKQPYGFVNFDSEENAQAFINSMQNKTYNGRPLQFRMKDDQHHNPTTPVQIPGLVVTYKGAPPFASNKEVFNLFAKNYLFEIEHWDVNHQDQSVIVAPTYPEDIIGLKKVFEANSDIISSIEETSVTKRKSLHKNESSGSVQQSSSVATSRPAQKAPNQTRHSKNLTNSSVNAIQIIKMGGSSWKLNGVKIDGSSWSLDEVKGFWYAVFRKLKMTAESATQWTDLLAINIDHNEVVTTFPNELIQESFIDPITNIPDWKISFMLALSCQVPKSIKKMYTDEFIEVGYSAISAQSVQLPEEKTPLTVLEPAPTVRASELGTIEQQRNYTQEQPAAFALPYSLFIGINEPHQDIIGAVFRAGLPIDDLTHLRTKDRNPQCPLWPMASGSIEVIYSSDGAYYTKEDYKEIMNELWRSLLESGIRHFTIRIQYAFRLEEIDPNSLVLFREIRDQPQLIEPYDTIKANRALRIAETQTNGLSIFHQPAIEELDEPLRSQETPPSDTDGSPALK